MSERRSDWLQIRLTPSERLLVERAAELDGTAAISTAARRWLIREAASRVADSNDPAPATVDA